MNSLLLTLLCVYLGASPALGCYCFLPIWNSNQEGGFYPMPEDGRHLARFGLWSHNPVETGDDKTLEVDGIRHKRDTAGAEVGGGLKIHKEAKSGLGLYLDNKITREGKHDMKINQMPSENVGEGGNKKILEANKFKIKFGGFADGSGKVTKAESTKGSSNYNHADGSKEENSHNSKSSSNAGHSASGERCSDSKKTIVMEKRIAAGFNGSYSFDAVKGRSQSKRKDEKGNNEKAGEHGMKIHKELHTDVNHKKSKGKGSSNAAHGASDESHSGSKSPSNAAHGASDESHSGSKSPSNAEKYGGFSRIYLDSKKSSQWEKRVARGKKVDNSSGALTHGKVGIKADATHKRIISGDHKRMTYDTHFGINGGSYASKTGNKVNMGKEHKAESDPFIHTQEIKSEDVKVLVPRPVLN